MKILESQNAVLTNFEVYQHMLNEQHKFKNPDRRKKVPRSVQNIIKEASIPSIPKLRQAPDIKTDMQQIVEYLRTSPNPFSQNPITYNGFTIRRLVEKLRDYDLTKGEMIMILNVRPENGAVLSACVDDFVSRFTEDQQNEIMTIIEEVLGPFPPREHAEEGAEDEGA